MEAKQTFSAKYNVPEIEKIKMELIVEIIKLRKQAKLSQKELAEKCGMKQPQLAKIEDLDGNPTIETLLRVLVVFHKKLVVA
ncbi:helix-turn-helix domain-containing protein [Listeria newyorkensis]|uniref:Helix-turn-helix transcriptional regulator n=1 Tax=Listeria newyorkensis TaxID=1497681 RepID=A0A841YXB9_9LIST|nr:helix-turn-helix transcriptional regulator [Listeria newyorkensis]MBC1458174.1 helix-turn-helix transcriptional regulator [Listeria newyorkensis]